MQGDTTRTTLALLFGLSITASSLANGPKDIVPVISLLLLDDSVVLQPARILSDTPDGASAGNHDTELESSAEHAISGDGRYVLTETEATDLTSLPDANGNTPDLVVHDALAGDTVFVAPNTDNDASSNDVTDLGVISLNGRFVAFESDSTDLVTGFTDTNSGQDIFVRDLINETTELASYNDDGTATGTVYSNIEAISSNGRYVLFTNRDSMDIAGVTDGNGDFDLFRRDMDQETTQLININTTGTASSNEKVDSRGYSRMSDSANFVVFTSRASDLTANDENNDDDVFLRNIAAETTTLISVDTGGESSTTGGSDSGRISADGQFIGFNSTATDLVTGITDAASFSDVFLRDIGSSSTELVSINSASTGPGNGYSYIKRVSQNGRYVLFSSTATDLVAGITDANGVDDIFLRDMVTGTTELVSINADGTDTINGQSEGATMSGNGRYIVFASRGSDVIEGFTDNNGTDRDGYLRDMKTGESFLVSRSTSGATDSGNGHVGRIIINREGSAVAWHSAATDHVEGVTDSNDLRDVFWSRIHR